MVIRLGLLFVDFREAGVSLQKAVVFSIASRKLDEISLISV